MKILNSTITLILAVTIGLLMAISSASAQPIDAGPLIVADAGEVEQTPAQRAEENPAEVAGEVVADVRSGNWRHAASGLLAFLMLGLAKFRDKVSWFKGDRGGAVLVGLLGLFGAFSTSLASDAPLDLQLFLGMLGVIWTAVGGYTWIKQLIWPRDKKEDAEDEGAELIG